MPRHVETHFGSFWSTVGCKYMHVDGNYFGACIFVWVTARFAYIHNVVDGLIQAGFNDESPPLWALISYVVDIVVCVDHLF